VIQRISELQNTLLVRPWLLDDFSYTRPDGSIYHEEPTVPAAKELQQSCQNILQVFANFRALAKSDLKTNAEWRREFLPDIGPRLDKLMNYPRFRPRIVPYDSTGDNDYELIQIVDLYGLNDLIEYSLVLLASEPSLIKTDCLFPSQENPDAIELGAEAILGRCPHCHMLYIRTRVDQRYCSPYHSALGPVMEEWEQEMEESKEDILIESS
jgi:hypothetical protein